MRKPPTAASPASARNLGTDTQRGGELVIKALAELTDYPTELKSMTGGRGRYSLDLIQRNAQARHLGRN